MLICDIVDQRSREAVVVDQVVVWVTKSKRKPVSAPHLRLVKVNELDTPLLCQF